MADIYMQIQQKYGIDIQNVNLLKLYKIDKKPEVSPAELEKAFADTKKRWNQSINGANERLAERDRAHLNNAEVYEAILKDAKLRKELYSYYNKSAEAGGSTELSKEYFALLATTKKIKKKDIEFFFQYFAEERKNKKAILEMLEKEYKIRGLIKGDKSQKGTETESEEIEVEGKKKNSSILVSNWFQEATILKLRKCEGFLKKAKESESVRLRYPLVDKTLYEFLKVDEMSKITDMKDYVTKMRDEVFNLRQEKGIEYAPLVDFYNSMADMLDYKDVCDNWKEFQIIIKYSKLTPYMYGLTEMKPESLNGLYKIAGKEYSFRDLNDFIINYFQLVYGNFNIQIQAVKKIINKAKTKTASNKIINSLDEKLGIKRDTSIPKSAMVVHWLVYWPIFITYFVFEIIKTIFINLKKLAIPVAVLAFIFFSWLIPQISNYGNILGLFIPGEYQEFFYYLNGFYPHDNLFIIVDFILAIVMLCLLYGVPSFLCGSITYELGNVMTSYCDWVGIERTFKGILESLYLKTKTQYSNLKQRFISSKIMKIILNVLCLILLILFIGIL